MLDHSSFTDAFQQLVASAAEFNTLYQLEHSYSLALSQLLFEKNISIKKTHERQEQEMSLVCKNAIQNNVSAVVRRHVLELQELEKKVFTLHTL